MNMTPPPPRTFARGPSLAPSRELLTWLDGQIVDGKARLVRLPVTMKDGRVSPARLGAAADALQIDVNDSALGVGLADRCRTKPEPWTTCSMWLEGYWRGKVHGELRFDVIYVHAVIAPGELASATYAEVESS